jgi:DNA invertase Pin-like site-specific DNA recombinase
MNEKIKPEHLQRAAYVYIRQSTAYQVRFHLEGQKRQYGLSDRAHELGFAQVVVIDEDLGRSGSGLQERPGFGRLLAAVCQGTAGAVVALEASRLARNNRDWHHLVDLCALTDTLLIDDDGIYDPKLLNDRLLLGLKGTMSEFELGLLRQRARQAFVQKVKRGCAMWEVPVGFVRTEDGQIEKSPDRQVQQAIEAVFSKFNQLGSARQTVIWFREEHILLPQAKPGSEGKQADWLLATISRVHQILRNPCYAGAFAYGRTGTKTSIIEGRAQRSPSRLYKALEQWEVLIREHHPGYISWEQYLKNRQVMAKNLAQRKGEAGGAAKKGPALLSGLMRCGCCGRRLQVLYSGSEGQVGRYVCNSDRVQRGSSACLSVGSLRTDGAVVAEVLAAVEPAGIEAALKASAQAQLEDHEKHRAVELALEKARYEARRAQRQFDAVEPENRLVAAELEARWNQALAKVSELEGRVQGLQVEAAQTISAEQRQRLAELGKDLKRLWEDPQAPIELKKRILRTVIEEIVVTSQEEPAEHRLQIHWAGGVHTELRVPRNPSGMHGRMADRSVIELVRELAKVCDDKAIAAVLNRLGYTTGQGNSWRLSRVTSFRHTHGIELCTAGCSSITLQAATQRLKISDTAVERLIRQGILPARQVVKYAPWVIEERALELPAVQAAVQAVQKGKRIPSALAEHPELPIK